MAWVYLLFALSGAAGLIYEVVWARMLVLGLGSTAYATSTVLGAFMVGLALGNALGGRILVRGRHHPLAVYATLQALIGLVGLVLPALLGSLDGLVAGVERSLWGVPAAWGAMRVALAFGLLVIPTLCMGATLPVVAKYAVTEMSRVGRGVGALYAINTLGAVVGAVAAGFLLIEAFGTWGASAAAACLNGMAWLGAWMLSGRPPAPRRAEGPMARRVGAGDAAAWQRRIVYGAITVSGLSALGYGVIWARSLVFIVGNSTYALSTMLAVFLWGIALGSAVMGRFADRARAPVLGLGVVMLAMAFTALLTIPVIWGLLGLPDARDAVGSERSWLGSVGLSALVSCGVMVVPAALGGAAFPLAVRIVTTMRERMPRALGDIALVNTLGAIAGALLTGFILVPLLGLSKGIIVLAGINLAAGIACILTARGTPKPAGALAGGGAALFILAALVMPTGQELRTAFERPGGRTLFYDEGPAATVKVYEKPDGKKMMIVNGHAIGDTRHGIEQREKLLAHLPVILAPRAEKVLAIGLGSGMKVGAIALHEEVRTIDVVESVPGVVRAAVWFAQENRGVLGSSKVRIRTGDGIHHLLTSPVHYDLISSDAMLGPDSFGNAVFYSQEYYRRCRDRLVPGGMLCQWVPYNLPRVYFRMALRTFLSIFPETTLWNFGSEGLLVIGTNGPMPIDYERLTQRMRHPTVERDLASFGFDSPNIFLSHFVAGPEGVARLAGMGPLNTWAHPLIEFRGPRASRQLPRADIEVANLELVQKQAEPLGTRLVNVDRDIMARAAKIEEINRALAATREYVRGLIVWKRAGSFEPALAMFRRSSALNPEDTRAQRMLERALSEVRELQMR